MSGTVEWVDALRRICDTADGKRLFEALKAAYVDQSCFRDSEHATAYSLGKKELVQDLMFLASTTDEDFQPNPITDFNLENEI